MIEKEKEIEIEIGIEIGTEIGTENGIRDIIENMIRDHIVKKDILGKHKFWLLFALILQYYKYYMHLNWINYIFNDYRSHRGKDRGDKYKDSFSEGLKRDDKSSSDSEWVYFLSLLYYNFLHIILCLKII